MELTESTSPARAAGLGGLVHAPLTPFAADGSLDLGALDLLLRFHLEQGASALCLPTHVGESPNLSEAERRLILERAIAVADGRVPVIAHVTQPGTGQAVALARHAEEAGAAEILIAHPYYWKPPGGSLEDHFAAVAEATALPLTLLNSPGEMGVSIDVPMVCSLLERLPTLIGVADASNDWQYLAEVRRLGLEIRPEFRLTVIGEYMTSAATLGAEGMISPLAGIAPSLVGSLFAACSEGDYRRSVPLQYELSALAAVVGAASVPGLRAAAALMGRSVGEPRLPLIPCSPEDLAQIRSALAGLDSEPRGW